MVTGTVECSATSRLVLPRRVPPCAANPRDPTTKRSAGFGSGDRAQQRRTGVAVDHGPLDVRRRDPGSLGNAQSSLPMDRSVLVK